MQLDPGSKPEDVSSWSSVCTDPLPLIPIPSGQDPSVVPALAHGLQGVLRGDGLYSLHSKCGYKGKSKTLRNSKGKQCCDPSHDYLRTIVPPERILWEKLPKYVPAALDYATHAIASHTKGVSYTSSTSSVTAALSAFYHLMSNFRDTELVGGLSPHLGDMPINFTKIQRLPVAFTFEPTKISSSVFSVTAHNRAESGPTILQELGHSLERMLITPPQEFLDKFVTDEKPWNLEKKAPSGKEEQFYHYSRASRFLLRAQIDCRNPDNGEVFDVKTRAVAPIRYNLPNYKHFASRRPRSLLGISDSYEREFYDMVRSVFIKYGLQLRIGRMAGALVAYHNTSELLGFEYISLNEIETYIYGSSQWAGISFATTVRLFEIVLEKVRKTVFSDSSYYGDQRVRVVMSTERTRRRMTIFAERLSRGVPDLLGPDVFQRVDGRTQASAVASNRSFSQLWHYDSYLHPTTKKGVAYVGPSCSSSTLEGENVPHLQSRNRIHRAGVHRHLNVLEKYDTSCLVPNRFFIWHLDIAPVVNGILVRKGGINLKSDDIFDLKYSLRRVDINNTLVTEYLTSLGRYYGIYGRSR